MGLLIPLAVEHFSNAAATNFPQYISVMPGGAYRSALAFEHTVSQKCVSIALPMPAFTGALTLKVLFAIAATSDNVQFRAQIENNKSFNCSTTESYDTANSSGSVSVPASTFHSKSFDITLTNNDTLTEGDTFKISLDRDVSVGSNASGLCYVLGVSLWDES